MDDKILKDAQYRKGLSIAFFNATNAAIELVKDKYSLLNINEATKKVVELRDFFLSEHKTYYATVIAQVGANYNSSETIEKIKATKNLDELKAVWLALSEDERRDGDIIKVKDSMKLAYEKT